MEIEVRSDFRLALQVRDVNGLTRTVGHFSHEVGETVGNGVVPHLQRVDPKGHWLASYDVEGQRIVLDVVDGSGATARQVAVTGALGAPRQFRWLDDSSGFVVMTEDQLYVLPLHATRASTEPRPVAQPKTPHPVQMRDVRVMDGGLLVRYDEVHPADLPAPPLTFETGIDFISGDERLPTKEAELGSTDYYAYAGEDLTNGRGQMMYVALDGHRAASVHPFARTGKSVTGAMTLSGGRVVATVGDFDNEPWAYPQAHTMLIATPSAEGWTVTSRTPCDGECEATNWAPGADVPIYSMWGEVRIDGEEPTTLDVGGGGVHVLWNDTSRDLLLTGTDDILALWHGGEKRWSYTAPEQDLHSARLSASGDYVWAITDAEILRFSVATGEHRRIKKIRTYNRASDQEGNEDNEWVYTSREEYRRLDGVVPLPNGGVAYGVLEVKEESESY